MLMQPEPLPQSEELLLSRVDHSVGECQEC